MSADPDTQRTLEQKALANVRALVDKVEAEDRHRTADAVKLTLKLVPFVLAVMVAAFLAMKLLGPQPVALAPPKTAAEYADRALAKIATNANAKLRKDLQGMNGRVGVRFDVRADGRTQEIQVVQSSWDAKIDGEAKNVVKLAEPFGRLPEGVAAPLQVSAAIRFDAGALTVEPQGAK